MVREEVKMKSKKLFYTVAEAAKVCGVSKSTVYRRIKAGVVKAFRIRKECVECVKGKKRLECGSCDLHER
jgi:excisionase family DNA binding protein